MKNIFQKNETQYIIKRFNNDFISKCFINDKIKKMEVNENNFIDIKKMIVESFVFCKYNFRTKDYFYTISYTEKGLNLSKINIENKQEQSAVLSWDKLCREIIRQIKDDEFLNEKQKNASVFVPSLYSTIVKNDDKFFIQINKNKEIEDIKSYVINFIKFSKNHQITVNVLKKYNCHTNENIKNKLFIDCQFLKDIQYAMLKLYNDLIFATKEGNDYVYAQNNLVFLHNIKNIKKVFNIDRSLGDMIIYNNQKYIISDIKDNDIILKNEQNSVSIKFVEFTNLCKNNPKSSNKSKKENNNDKTFNRSLEEMEK